MIFRPAAALLAILALVCAAVRADETPPPIGQDPMAQRYALGHGLPLGDTGFTLGGYAEAGYANPRGADNGRVAVDALSAFLWWDGGGRWRFFSETELSEPLRWGEGGVKTGDADLISERLYVDYAWRDALKFRAGKFLTPVGRWNLRHAAPLTWTTSRPLISEATFPTNATGAMAYGVLPLTPAGVEYSLYVSPGKELFRRDDLDTFTEAYGLRLSTPLWPTFDVGLSWVSFEQTSNREIRKQLLGVDAQWLLGRAEISGEFTYRELKGGASAGDESGWYLQAVLPLIGDWFAIVRNEGFHQRGAARDLSLWLGGVAWRPNPAFVIKAEYGHAVENAARLPEGFRASIAVLF